MTINSESPIMNIPFHFLALRIDSSIFLTGGKCSFGLSARFLQRGWGANVV